MCDKSPGGAAAERDPDAPPCQVAGEASKGASARRRVGGEGDDLVRGQRSTGLGPFVLHEGDAPRVGVPMAGWLPVDPDEDGIGEERESRPRTTQIPVQLEEHDGRLRRPCRELRGEAVAQRSTVTGLGGDDGVGTIAAHGDGRRRARRRHRHDRHSTTELRLDRPGERLDEGAPLPARRPALEHDDLARPPRPVADDAHGLLQPTAEQGRHPLVQRRMELEQASERLARQEDQHGIERDARGHRAPFVRDEHRLAEDLSRPVACDGPRAVDDVDGARNDQVERVGLVARLVDRLALGERGLAEETDDVARAPPRRGREMRAA